MFPGDLGNVPEKYLNVSVGKTFCAASASYHLTRVLQVDIRDLTWNSVCGQSVTTARTVTTAATQRKGVPNALGIVCHRVQKFKMGPICRFLRN